MTDERMLEVVQAGLETLRSALDNRDAMHRIELQLVEVRTAVIGSNGHGGVLGRVGDHERRLRAAERWRYAIPPTIGISVAGIIVAALTQ